MTNIELTQKVAHVTISLFAQSVVVTQIDNNTDIDVEDNIPVRVGAIVVGELVARQTDKVTKPMIAKAAAKIASWKNRNATDLEEVVKTAA